MLAPNLLTFKTHKYHEVKFTHIYIHCKYHKSLIYIIAFTKLIVFFWLKIYHIYAKTNWYTFTLFDH